MTLTRPGKNCPVCGAPIDRRATFCRDHRPDRHSAGRTGGLRAHAANRQQRWLLDLLATLPVSMPLIPPAAILPVLLQALDEPPTIEHPAYAVYDTAAAYAAREHPAADDVQRAGFAVVIHAMATGMSGPFEPPSTPDIEQGEHLVLALLGGQPPAPGETTGLTPLMTPAGQTIAPLPPDAMALLVVLTLETAYFGDGYEAALREGMAALLSVRGQSATLARRSIQDLWREHRA